MGEKIALTGSKTNFAAVRMRTTDGLKGEILGEHVYTA